MRGESWSLSLRFSEWPGWGRSAGAGSGTRPSPKSQERSVALLQTMPGSELTSPPFLLQSALCLRAWRDWPEQLAGTQQDVLLDRLCLAFPETESFPTLSFPAFGCCTFKNSMFPEPTSLPEVQEPQDGSQLPCSPAA